MTDATTKTNFERGYEAWMEVNKDNPFPPILPKNLWPEGSSEHSDFSHGMLRAGMQQSQQRYWQWVKEQLAVQNKAEDKGVSAKPSIRGGFDADREAREDARSIAAEAYWKEKQGDEYGSY